MLNNSKITFNPFEVSSYYATRVPHLKRRRAVEWRGPCPIHRGKNDNFAVDPATGRWFCFSACGRGGGILEFERALTGADFKTALAAVCAIVGRPIPGRAEYTPGKRQEKQQDQRQAQRERSEAGYFADAAAMFAKQALKELSPFDPERAVHTRLLRNLSSDPVAVYRQCRQRNPARAAAFAEAGRNSQRRMQTWLAHFIKGVVREDETDAA